MRSAGHVLDTPDLERSFKNAWRFTLRFQVLASVINGRVSQFPNLFNFVKSEKVGNIWTATDVNNCLLFWLEELLSHPERLLS
jgi:hypothetical protein